MTMNNLGVDRISRKAVEDITRQDLSYAENILTEVRNKIRELPYVTSLEVDCISREDAEDITWEEPSYEDSFNILTEVRDKVRELPSVTFEE
jgi:hypothetical protein